MRTLRARYSVCRTLEVIGQRRRAYAGKKLHSALHEVLQVQTNAQADAEDMQNAPGPLYRALEAIGPRSRAYRDCIPHSKCSKRIVASRHKL